MLKEAEGIDLLRPMLAVHTKLMPMIHGLSSPTKGRPSTTTSIGIFSSQKDIGRINKQSTISSFSFVKMSRDRSDDIY